MKPIDIFVEAKIKNAYILCVKGDKKKYKKFISDIHSKLVEFSMSYIDNGVDKSVWCTLYRENEMFYIKTITPFTNSLIMEEFREHDDELCHEIKKELHEYSRVRVCIIHQPNGYRGGSRLVSYTPRSRKELKEMLNRSLKENTRLNYEIKKMRDVK